MNKILEDQDTRDRLMRLVEWWMHEADSAELRAERCAAHGDGAGFEEAVDAACLALARASVVRRRVLSTLCGDDPS